MPRLKIAWTLFLLVLSLFVASACASHAKPTASNTANSAARPQATWQVSAGFGGPVQTPMPVTAPTETVTPSAVESPNTPTPEQLKGIPMSIPTVRPTLSASRNALSPTSAPSSAPPAALPPATGLHCDNPNARITAPVMNETIRDSVPILGVASGTDFLYYKVQYMPESSRGTDKWGELFQSKTPIPQTGKLMDWHTNTVAPGAYWLRLIVADRTGNYPQPCEIRIFVN